MISTIPEGMPERLVLPMQSPSLHKAPGVVGENLHTKPHLGVSTSGTENRRNLGGSPGTTDFEVPISGFIGNSQLMVIRKLQPATHMKRKILQEVLVFGLCSRSFILDAPMVEFLLGQGPYVASPPPEGIAVGAEVPEVSPQKDITWIFGGC